MIRRMLFTLFVGLLLAVVPLQAAVAHETSKQSTYDTIWSGLWAGVNLDITGTFKGDQRPERTPTQNLYAALGDSVAAGSGLPLVVNASIEDSRCRRSSQAYPYKVASSLQLPLQHLACSGATAGDLFTKQRPGGPNIAPQIDAAFATGTPKVISITAGANDADWAGFIRNCYVYTCNTDTFDTVAKTRLAVLKSKLHLAFAQIKYKSAGTDAPVVIATGYYNPLSLRCAELQQNITRNEILWLGRQVDALNNTIIEAAQYYPNIRYAPVDFSGHDICSTDSWIQGLGEADPFHPNAAGQEMIARSVVRAAERHPLY